MVYTTDTPYRAGYPWGSVLKVNIAGRNGTEQVRLNAGEKLGKAAVAGILELMSKDELVRTLDPNGFVSRIDFDPCTERLTVHLKGVQE